MLASTASAQAGRGRCVALRNLNPIYVERGYKLCLGTCQHSRPKTCWQRPAQEQLERLAPADERNHSALDLKPLTYEARANKRIAMQRAERAMALPSIVRSRQHRPGTARQPDAGATRPDAVALPLRNPERTEDTVQTINEALSRLEQLTKDAAAGAQPQCATSATFSTTPMAATLSPQYAPAVTASGATYAAAAVSRDQPNAMSFDRTYTQAAATLSRMATNGLLYNTTTAAAADRGAAAPAVAAANQATTMYASINSSGSISRRSPAPTLDALERAAAAAPVARPPAPLILSQMPNSLQRQQPDEQPDQQYSPCLGGQQQQQQQQQPTFVPLPAWLDEVALEHGGNLHRAVFEIAEVTRRATTPCLRVATVARSVLPTEGLALVNEFMAAHKQLPADTVRQPLPAVPVLLDIMTTCVPCAEHIAQQQSALQQRIISRQQQQQGAAPPAAVAAARDATVVGVLGQMLQDLCLAVRDAAAALHTALSLQIAVTSDAAQLPTRQEILRVLCAATEAGLSLLAASGYETEALAELSGHLCVKLATGRAGAPELRPVLTSATAYLLAHQARDAEAAEAVVRRFEPAGRVGPLPAAFVEASVEARMQRSLAHPLLQLLELYDAVAAHPSLRDAADTEPDTSSEMWESLSAAAAAGLRAQISETAREVAELTVLCGRQHQAAMMADFNEEELQALLQPGGNTVMLPSWYPSQLNGRPVDYGLQPVRRIPRDGGATGTGGSNGGNRFAPPAKTCVFA